jgi:DNA modification methylase
MKDMMEDVICGDNMEVMKGFADNRFHSMVTDPPYGIRFMGKKWDHSVPEVAFFKEAFRVLKPGAFILVACGTRTQHRMACNIEDAGFDIRDVITWHYGSGFPKSLNISKAIDKSVGVEREDLGVSPNWRESKRNREQFGSMAVRGENAGRITAPATDEAKHWEGFGTALKPATEFWTLARKPINGTVAANVVEYGVGGLNIDGCRINLNGDYKCKANGRPSLTGLGDNYNSLEANQPDCIGRFPANVVFDEFTGAILDEQAPKTGAFAAVKKGQDGSSRGVFGDFAEKGDDGESFYGDGLSGASRFFYCAKASKKERDLGLMEMEEVVKLSIMRSANGTGNKNFAGGFQDSIVRNDHPTVKPVKLMRWLVRLITPPEGECIDPFCGSGTTGVACALEGMKFVGIEQDRKNWEISNLRISRSRTNNTNGTE